MTAALLSIAFAASLVTGQFAPQQAGSEPLEPALEVRVQRLGKELRCAVCQGLSMADSPSSMSGAPLDMVRELVSQGKTDEQVVAYFVERYGEWVLLEPTREGFNWFVWLGPIVLVLGALFVILRQIKQEPPPATAAPSSASANKAATPEAEDPY